MTAVHSGIAGRQPQQPVCTVGAPATETQPVCHPRTRKQAAHLAVEVLDSVDARAQAAAAAGAHGGRALGAGSSPQRLVLRLLRARERKRALRAVPLQQQRLQLLRATANHSGP